MSNTVPLVTIAVPSYNHAQYIEGCIRSLIAQDYENIELIIIDDGSVDNSLEVIKSFEPLCQERFVRFEYRHRPNKGLSATLNEALEWASGEFFSPIASDDAILPGKVSIQVAEMLADSTISACFGGVESMDEHSNVTGEKNRPRKVYGFEDVIMRRANLMAPTAMLRTEQVRLVGGYQSGIVTEDFYMWLALTHEGGKLLHCGHILSRYRTHDDNISRKKDVIWDSVEKCLLKYSEHRLFRQAYAYSIFIYAYDLQKLRDPRSKVMIKKALSYDKGFVWSRKFVRFFIRSAIGSLR